MSIEVPCPQCQCILKAPEGMEGKKARCKRCQHAFRIPGPKTGDAVESVGDAEPLSVVTDAPFAFGGSDGSPAEPVEPQPDSKSKSKYKSRTDKTAGQSPVRKSQYRSKGSPDGGGRKGRKVLLLLAFLLCIGGGAGGFYAYTEYQKSKAPHQPIAKSADATPSEKESAKSAEGASQPSKAEPIEMPKTAAAGSPRRDVQPAGPRRSGPRVSGGMKLPTFADKPLPYEKPAAKILLDHDVKAVKQVLVGGSEGPVVLVMRRTFDGLAGKGMKDTIDRYALNTLRRIDQTEISADTVKSYPRIGDVSAGGDRFAFEHPSGKLSVVQLGTKTSIVDGLDRGMADDQARGGNRAIAAIYFLTDDKVAIVTTGGVVESWDLISKKKVGESEAIPGAGQLVDRRSVLLHRDRDPEKSTIFAFAGGAIHSIRPGGKPQLALSLTHGARECLALAVDGSGNRIAVAFRAAEPGEHIRFLHARIGDPKPSADEALDAEFGVPMLAEWNRPETFGILTESGSGLCWDADTNQLIAGFRTQKPTTILVDGSKHWVLLPDATDAKKSQLVNVALPPEEYSPSLTGEKWKPLALTITADGVAK